MQNLKVKKDDSPTATASIWNRKDLSWINKTNPQTTITGNAGTATKLQTARSINGTNFDGSANVTWTLSDIGAAASSHTHSYLPLSGGTLTGETIFNNYLSLNASSSGMGGTGKGQLCDAQGPRW